MLEIRNIKCGPSGHRPAAAGGFTLIELMITVAIIGILAAIAYPSYQEHIRQTRRADAQSALMELAQFMERRYTGSGAYGDGVTPCNLPFTQSPKDGGAAFYNLSAICTASTFTLTATPTGAMAGDPCGNIRLTHTGQKTTTGTNCWRR